MLDDVVSDLVWKVECWLNRRLASSPVPAGERLFVPRGSSVDVAAGRTPESGKPALSVTVITYNRVALCGALLGQIRESLERAGLLEQSFVLVFEDRSEADYSPVLEQLARDFSGRHAFYQSLAWFGKPHRDRVFQAAFRAIRRLDPERTIFLEDDVELAPDFVKTALSLWDEIDDPMKAVLYLSCFDDDEVDGRWIRFRRRELPGGRLRLTQWFDLSAFLASRRFFEALDYDVFQTPQDRWRKNPRLSCGMPEQFVRRLRHRGNVYQVARTLAFHGQAPSLLNPEARTARVFDNRSSGQSAR
jgi:hypothetical protein